MSARVAFISLIAKISWLFVYFIFINTIFKIDFRLHNIKFAFDGWPDAHEMASFNIEFGIIIPNKL